MAQMLQSRVRKLVNIISSLLLFWAFSWAGFAQTTLIPGDLVVVSINGSNSTIEVVPLIDLDKNTSFSIKAGSDSISMFDVTLNNEVWAGNSIFISNESTEQISFNGELILNEQADQITLVQKDGEVIRLLFNANWGNESEILTENFDGAIPNVQLGSGANHQYYLKNGASGTSRMIKRMISDPAHWKSSDQPFNQFRTSFRVLPAPVIVFNQNLSTVMEGDSIPLNVAIYEHDGSRLTVDVVLNEAFSTADTNDINSFRSYTYNFTGLIGDAVYEIAIPLFDDSIFEDRETVFFDLQNLTGGTFGDFVSHATFIIDNEIPDLSIVSVNDSDEPNQDYFEILNNERVYVNIEGYKVQLGEEAFELKNLVDLAPFERRRIMASDFLPSVDDSEITFEISTNQIILLDGLDKTISMLEFNTDKALEAEITENNNSKMTLDFDLPETVIQQVGNEVDQTGQLETEDVPKRTGWYPVSSINLSVNTDYLFWDEGLSSFRDLSSDQMDSISGISLFQFISDSKNDAALDFIVDDSTITEENVIVLNEWKVILSATDLDNNGMINNSEGYNFIQFKGSDSIRVSNFLHQIEEQIGEDYLHPTVFRLDETLSLNPLNRQNYLYDGEFVWLKADSLFAKTEISINPFYNSTQQEFSLLIDEPISNFQIKASSAIGENSIDFNFYDVDVEVPNSQLNLLLDTGYNMTITDAPIFGAFTNLNWKSEVNIAYHQETLIKFPLGIMNDSSSEIRLMLGEWNMEGGWRLFIEDIEADEKFELLPGEEFEIEYLVETSISEEELSFSKGIINDRFHLLIASPEYEETMLDSPEQIQLNQNYPNPFNPATTISFFIPDAVEIKLSVFNVVGQPIAVLEEGTLSAGEHNYEWNASGYPSGMYIYQLEVDNKVMTRKMTLVK